MPILTYTFSEKEIDEIREIVEQMNIELGSIINDLNDEKTLKKAGTLSALQGKLNRIMFSNN